MTFLQIYTFFVQLIQFLSKLLFYFYIFIFLEIDLHKSIFNFILCLHECVCGGGNWLPKFEFSQFAGKFVNFWVCATLTLVKFIHSLISVLFSATVKWTATKCDKIVTHTRVPFSKPQSLLGTHSCRQGKLRREREREPPLCFLNRI